VENVKKPAVKPSKITESPLGKKTAKPPEDFKHEKQNVALTYLKTTKLKAKVKEVQSIHQARLTELETQF
jgi:hypothetical protein